MPDSRLLIVDDDSFIVSILKGILGKAGYEVRTAADGQAALDLLAADPVFDTILLDRQMPGMDGLQVLLHLKQSPTLKNIPVVLETAMDSEEAVKEGLKAGALYYLVKPLDPKMVLQVVAAATGEYATKRAFWAELEGTRSALGLIRRGLFRYRTLQQCHDLAAFLAKACPDPKRTVIGLSELMINAVEHGNLGISYDDKSALIEAQGWAAEVDRRLELAEYRDRRVTVTLTRSDTKTRFRIQDMGQGFPWQEFQEPNPERMFDSHGRGILLAKWEAFDRVEYQGSGNCVVAEIGQP
jgi:CheY-like chemotaxis protein/anti-sigma regulatory factor (Ser/Thr protein kinase)